MWDKRFGYVIRLVLLFAAYFVTARIGLTLNAVSGFATLVWAPTGIALAALIIMGYRFWPAITLAAFSVNVLTGAAPLVALGLGVGNTLEPLLGAYLLVRLLRFDSRMERVRDVFGLVLLAAMLSTTISATVGVSSLWLGGTVSTAAYGSTWLAWWVGDMLGALVVAPLLLVWNRHWPVKLRPKLLAEMTSYLVVLAAVSALVFHGDAALGIKPLTLAYVIFPILIWTALRFGQIGSVTATFVASVVAIWGTIASSHVSGISLSHRLLLLQSFMGITAVTFMIMAAVVAERERTQYHRQRLAQKAKLLTQQRTRLLALNQAKDDFIAVASHQLRTPATSVKQYTGMLLGNYAGRLTKYQKELLTAAYNSNERQLAVVDMLLHVALLDSGAIVLNKEAVDLTRLINEIVAFYNVNLAPKRQTVKFNHHDDNCVAMIDREKFRMVLENLIDNASKYSPLGKEIDIELKRDKRQIAISVQDSGVGIIKKDIQKLFKKFSRIDNAQSNEVGGTGLGLYWAKRIISLHQGSIKVNSSPNKGSTFTVVLPYSGG